MIDDTPSDPMNQTQAMARRAKRPRKAGRQKLNVSGQPTPRRGRGLRGRAGRVIDQGSRVLTNAAASVSNAANTARGFASEMHIPGRRSFESMIDANPLILGAIGLGLGVVIGTLLPRNSMDSGMQAIGLSSASPRSGNTRGRKIARKGSGRGAKRAGGRKSSGKKQSA